MRRLVLQTYQTPEVLKLADEVKDPLGLDAWLRSVWLFVADPPNAEYVKSPVFQFHESLENFRQTGRLFFQGDCDDAATLAGAILKALEVPAWFTAIRMGDNPEYEHVFTTAWLGDHVLQIDPIVPADQMPIQGVAEVMEMDL